MAALVLATLLVLYGVATERAGLFNDDTRHYALMAEDPSHLVRLPYTFRVLTPVLVHLLPFETTSSFMVVTMAALWLSAIFLYVFLRTIASDPWVGIAGVCLFLGSGATIRALTTPMYVDGLTYLTEVAAFYLLLVGRYRLLALTLTIGVLNRETTLLLVPVYLLQLRAEGRLNRRELSEIALVLGLPLLGLACVVVVKLVIGGALDGGLSVLQPNLRTFRQNVPDWRDIADIYSVFGVGWLLAAANLPNAPPLLRRGLLFGLLVVLQLAVSRGDEGRNLSHLLPLVVPLAALEFRHLGRAHWSVLLLGCLMSMVNFRWIILPAVGLRYSLVASGTVLALGIACWRRRVHNG